LKCYFCKIFDGKQKAFGKPCCSICKQTIEINSKFCEIQESIVDSFKKIEKNLNRDDP